MSEEKLLNLAQLADALGVSYQFAKDASTAGLPLVAGRTTRSDVLSWMREQPDFRAEARLARALVKKRNGESKVPCGNRNRHHTNRGCHINERKQKGATSMIAGLESEEKWKKLRWMDEKKTSPPVAEKTKDVRPTFRGEYLATRLRKTRKIPLTFSRQEGKAHLHHQPM